MTDIQIEIQGKDAIAATEELLSISGLSGNWEAVDEGSKEPVLTTIATIIGLVGGTVAIAEQIRKWYHEYKQGKSGKNIEYVLVVKGDKRLLLKDATLDDATVKQIEQILED